jgi:hypothetical protein
MVGSGFGGIEVDLTRNGGGWGWEISSIDGSRGVGYIWTSLVCSQCLSCHIPDGSSQLAPLAEVINVNTPHGTGYHPCPALQQPFH